MIQKDFLLKYLVLIDRQDEPIPRILPSRPKCFIVELVVIWHPIFWQIPFLNQNSYVLSFMKIRWIKIKLTTWIRLILSIMFTYHKTLALKKETTGFRIFSWKKAWRGTHCWNIRGKKSLHLNIQLEPKIYIYMCVCVLFIFLLYEVNCEMSFF